MTGMDELRSQGLLCDYTLNAENTTVKVHRAVLVACSDYFRAMLTGNMKESQESEVTLQGISGLGLQTVVDFAYSGKLSLDLDNLEEVLAAASHLQVSEAIDLCCQFLEKAISMDNCIDILNLTELYSLNQSTQTILNFLLEHFERLAASEHYHRLNFSQLAQLLSKNGLKVTSEYKLFELVLKWISFDSQARTPYVHNLMQNVRLPLLSGEELVDKVSRVDIMKQNKACSELLTEAKDYHIVVSKQPMLQTKRTQVRSEKRSLVMCHAESLESYDFVSERHCFLKDAPVPQYNPCICVVDNFMYACGGKYDSNENNEIATARCFRYDPRFDSWFELPSMNEARKDFVMVASNNALYAIAGQDESSVMCTCEYFSIQKNDWEAFMPLNYEVNIHAGTLYKDRIYISGGQKFEGHCNNVMSYNPAANTWRSEESLIHARSNHNMVTVGDDMYVIGGCVEDQYGFPIPVTTIEQYNPDAGHWTTCEGDVNIREAGACVMDKRIYIVGGINGGHYYSNLIQRFEPSEDQVRVVDRFPSRIYGRTCCILTLPQYV